MLKHRPFLTLSLCGVSAPNSETLRENPNLLHYCSQKWTRVIVSSGFSFLLCFLPECSPLATNSTEVLKTEFTRKKKTPAHHVISCKEYLALDKYW